MELVHLHVLQGYAPAVGDGHAVASAGEGVTGNTPCSSIATRGEEHCFGMEGVNFSCANLQRHNAAGLTIVEQQVEREEFTEEAYLVFHCALVHRLENHMAGAISRVAGASYRGLAEVARVATEATLVDTSIRGAVKRQAAMFKFVDGINCLACQDLSRGLVYQVVTAFDGIVHVPFPMVFF